MQKLESLFLYLKAKLISPALAPTGLTVTYRFLLFPILSVTTVVMVVCTYKFKFIAPEALPRLLPAVRLPYPLEHLASSFLSGVTVMLPLSHCLPMQV